MAKKTQTVHKNCSYFKLARTRMKNPYYGDRAAVGIHANLCFIKPVYTATWTRISVNVALSLWL